MDYIGQSNFLQALGWAVLNSLWQMALLWVVYQLFTGVFRKARPAHKSSLASVLLIAGFSWFVFTFISILISETSNDVLVAGGFVGIAGNQQLNDWLYQTLPIASIIYLILLAFPLVHYIRNYRFVQIIRNYGLIKADVDWRMFVRKVAAQLEIKRKVQIWVSDLVTSPVTIGYLKPVILVPVAAVNNLSMHQMEAVLLHELAHIRHYDYFINLIIKFIQSVLYFNPFVKAFVKIVEREREKSCDEMVMQFQYDPHGYASALLTLEKADKLPKPLAVAASGKKHDLLHRIEWIMGVKKKPVVSFNRIAGLFAGLLCIIVLNALVILSKPVVTNSADGDNSLAQFTSPLYFFADMLDKPMMEETVQLSEIEEIPQPEIVSVAKPLQKLKVTQPPKNAKQKVDMAAIAERVNYFTANPYAAAVAYMEAPEIPILDKNQEKQVKEAILASKKVLEAGKWKEMESQIAEALTQQQKEELHRELRKGMNKMDWKKWEDKLRAAYDRVDWEKVNVQLATAVNNIRIDSLNSVYAKALTNLTIIEKELKQLEICSIPDSDISLENLSVKKKEVIRAMDSLKSSKKKKVVHL